MRYLSEVARSMVFNTSESALTFSENMQMKDSYAPSFDIHDHGIATGNDRQLKDVVHAQGLQKLWRENRMRDTLANKRIENRAWRALSRANISDLDKGFEEFILDDSPSMPSCADSEREFQQDMSRAKRYHESEREFRKRKSRPSKGSDLSGDNAPTERNFSDAEQANSSVRPISSPCDSSDDKEQATLWDSIFKSVEAGQVRLKRADKPKEESDIESDDITDEHKQRLKNRIARRRDRLIKRSTKSETSMIEKILHKDRDSSPETSSDEKEKGKPWTFPSVHPLSPSDSEYEDTDPDWFKGKDAPYNSDYCSADEVVAATRQVRDNLLRQIEPQASSNPLHFISTPSHRTKKNSESNERSPGQSTDSKEKLKKYIYYGTDIESANEESPLPVFKKNADNMEPKKVRNPRSLSGFTFPRAVGKIGKGGLCMEYSDYGTGDFRNPSFSVTDSYDGSNMSPLRYKAHQIFSGKLPMPDGLPGIRTISSDDASSLVITMFDMITGLEIDLIYVVMHEFDAITRRVVFRNEDRRALGCRSICGGPTVFVDGKTADNPHDDQRQKESEDQITASGERPGDRLEDFNITCPIPKSPEAKDGESVAEQPQHSFEESEYGTNYAKESPQEDISIAERYGGKPHSSGFQRSGWPAHSCPKRINRAFSMTLDLDSQSEAWYMQQLSGSWGRECQIVETKLTQGTTSFGSTRGVSSHQHNPYCAISTGPPSETRGEVKGFSFVYSSNFLIEAEVNEMKRLRINIGINPHPMQWNLHRGEVSKKYIKEQVQTLLHRSP